MSTDADLPSLWKMDDGWSLHTTFRCLTNGIMRSIVLVVVAFCVASSKGFVAVVPPSAKKSGVTVTSLGMTVLSYNGKKKDFKAGSPLSRAVAQLGVPVKYSCKKGDCATCQISLAGRMTRCCTGKVPEAPKLKSLQEKGLEIRA